MKTHCNFQNFIPSEKELIKTTKAAKHHGSATYRVVNIFELVTTCDYIYMPTMPTCYSVTVR